MSAKKTTQSAVVAKKVPEPQPSQSAMFSDLALAAFDQQLMSEVLRERVDMAAEEMTGWDNAFSAWCNEAKHEIEELEKSTGPEESRRRLIERAQRDYMITEAAQRRFQHIMVLAMRRARDEVAAWVERIYPDASGREVAELMRFVSDAKEFGY